MKIIVASVIVAVAILLGSFWLVAGLGDDGGGESLDSPGSEFVHQRIRSLTDCNALEREWQIAKGYYDESQDPASLSYMATARIRMDDLGCYGG